MNESDVNKLAAGSAEPAQMPIVSFGRALAVAREARGLGVGEIAARLRLQPRQIRAIESEDLSALPQGPFVRGFIRNYAKEVGIDARPLLAALQSRLQPAAPFADEVPAGAAISPVQLAQREQISRLIVVGGAVAALLLFAVSGWLAMRSAPPGAVASAPQAAPVPAAPVSAAPAASVPAAEPAPVASDAAPPPPAEPADAANDSGAAPQAVSDALQFRFREPAWVEIVQGDGKVLMSQNNAAGSQQTVAGMPPYSLVIGNASAVELEYRGKPVDLSALRSRENVARLRLE